MCFLYRIGAIHFNMISNARTRRMHTQHTCAAVKPRDGGVFDCYLCSSAVNSLFLSHVATSRGVVVGIEFA